MKNNIVVNLESACKNSLEKSPQDYIKLNKEIGNILQSKRTDITINLNTGTMSFDGSTFSTKITDNVIIIFEKSQQILSIPKHSLAS